MRRKKRNKKKLSRATKGSKRRQNAKHEMAKVARKIARRRSAYNHKVTTDLTRRFSYIALEDLQVKNMTASAKGDMENPGTNVKAKARLNRAVLNVGFYQFRNQLEYKAHKSGSVVVVVPPHHTSQCCSKCGYTSIENRRSQAAFHCTNCSFKANADYNAARNILMRANPSAGVPARRKSPSEVHGKKNRRIRQRQRPSVVVSTGLGPHNQG